MNKNNLYILIAVLLVAVIAILMSPGEQQDVAMDNPTALPVNGMVEDMQDAVQDNAEDMQGAVEEGTDAVEDMGTAAQEHVDEMMAPATTDEPDQVDGVPEGAEVNGGGDMPAPEATTPAPAPAPTAPAAQ